MITRRARAVGVATALFLLGAGAGASAGDEPPPAQKTTYQPPLKPGTRAPIFQLRALDGAKVKLDELAYPGPAKSYAKKRPILLDFFRTDCVPCQHALPELVKLAAGLKAVGVDVILVALLEQEDGRGKLDRFLAANKLPFLVLVDENEYYAKKYLGNPVSLPATFLIDQDGGVVKTKYNARGSYEAYFGEAIHVIVPAYKPSAAPAEASKE